MRRATTRVWSTAASRSRTPTRWSTASRAMALVTVLAVHGFLEDTVGNLHPIALEQALLLVDWRKARRLRAVDEGLSLV